MYRRIFLVLFFGLVWWGITWESPNMTEHNRSLEDCIKYSSFGPIKNSKIVSAFQKFDVELVKSDFTCINPYFPTIKITALNSHLHDAWLHIVHSDAKEEQWRNFIDADQHDYPFYSFTKHFLDSPLWSYGIFSKPLSYWEGHVYSVSLKKGKIKFLGGIKWGFKLSPFRLRPIIISPTALTQKDFDNDINNISFAQ